MRLDEQAFAKAQISKREVNRMLDLLGLANDNVIDVSDTVQTLYSKIVGKNGIIAGYDLSYENDYAIIDFGYRYVGGKIHQDPRSTRPLEHSRDTYIDLILDTGEIALIAVGNNLPEPAVITGGIRLGRYITDINSTVVGLEYDIPYIDIKNYFTLAMKDKIDNIFVTLPIDLDSINTRVSALDSAITLKGEWDASTGLFPTVEKAGESWIVIADGVVDGAEFVVNDRIIALVDNASDSVYADNWHKADYTDKVQSVDGQVGAVDLSIAYEPKDTTILKDADIDVTVQSYNEDTVIDSSYVHTEENYTTAEKTLVDKDVELDTTASTIPTAINELNDNLNTHNHDSDYLDIEHEASNIVAADITNLSNLSGTNTGDQDGTTVMLSSYAKADTAEAIDTDDQVQVAISKLEKGLDDAIEGNGEVNVQADWNETDSGLDSYIQNKPENLVQDASYIHTDENYTTEEKTKVGLLTVTDAIDLDVVADDVSRLDSEVDTVVSAIGNLSSAQASFRWSNEGDDDNNILIPVDGTDIAMSEYTIEDDSNDTDIMVLDAANGTFTFKVPGKYNFTTNVYVKAVSSSSTITPRIVMESDVAYNAEDDTELLNKTLDTLKVEQDVMIVPTDSLVEITQAMLDYVGGPITVSVEMGHEESVDDDKQVTITGFNSLLATVRSRIDDHSELTGTSDTGSHPASAISMDTVAFNGVLTTDEDSTQKVVDKLDIEVGKTADVSGTKTKVRYDRILATLDVIDSYEDGDDVVIRYTDDNDTDMYYRDILKHNDDGDLIEVKHYYATSTLDTASATTTITHNGNPVPNTEYKE